uniref:Secreted protein n=1 Tax=Setaria digitata TaxID=48799 RepID=A0A915PVH6_9BILA
MWRPVWLAVSGRSAALRAWPVAAAAITKIGQRVIILNDGSGPTETERENETASDNDNDHVRKALIARGRQRKRQRLKWVGEVSVLKSPSSSHSLVHRSFTTVIGVVVDSISGSKPKNGTVAVVAREEERSGRKRRRRRRKRSNNRRIRSVQRRTRSVTLTTPPPRWKVDLDETC